MNRTRDYIQEEAMTCLCCCDELEFNNFARQYKLPFDRFIEYQTGWTGIKANANGGICVYYYGDETMYFYVE